MDMAPSKASSGSSSSSSSSSGSKSPLHQHPHHHKKLSKKMAKLQLKHPHHHHHHPHSHSPPPPHPKHLKKAHKHLHKLHKKLHHHGFPLASLCFPSPCCLHDPEFHRRHHHHLPAPPPPPGVPFDHGEEMAEGFEQFPMFALRPHRARPHHPCHHPRRLRSAIVASGIREGSAPPIAGARSPAALGDVKMEAPAELTAAEAGPSQHA